MEPDFEVGTRVIIYFNGGETLVGNVSGVTPYVLTLTAAEGSYHIFRDKILAWKKEG